MTYVKTGGCQCGRIRFTAELDNLDAYPCHCRMCQRATGGTYAALVALKKANRQWETEPDYYASSPFARRPFCKNCGTPLGFEYLDGDKCDLTVGSFDDPSGFVPKSQFGLESRHEAWIDLSEVPGIKATDYEPLAERWKKAGLEMPE